MKDSNAVRSLGYSPSLSDKIISREKTRTMRPLQDQSFDAVETFGFLATTPAGCMTSSSGKNARHPYGIANKTLIRVKEKFKYVMHQGMIHIHFHGGMLLRWEDPRKVASVRWERSTSMPPGAERAVVMPTKIGIKRVQETTEYEARQEGLHCVDGKYANYLRGKGKGGQENFDTALESLQSLWDLLYPDQPWSSNPLAAWCDFKLVWTIHDGKPSPIKNAA